MGSVASFNGPERDLNPLRRLVEARFEIVEELADDAFEAIYLARHRELGDECVVKVLRHAGPEREEHEVFFRRHLPWITRLGVEGVARVHDVRLERGFAVIETEHVPGRPLEEVLADAVARDEEAPLPLGVALEIFDQVLAIAGRLHAEEPGGEAWVHGALSPAKLMVREEASGEDAGALRVRLVEPGVGRLLPGGERTTAGGPLARRLRYTAPERFLDASARLRPTADLYALGLVGYELLTGRYPISGESATALAAGHLMHPPLGFEQSDPRGRLPEPLRRLILRALAKDPAERPASTAELRRELGEIRGDLPVAGGLPGPGGVTSYATYDMTRARDEAVRRGPDAPGEAEDDAGEDPEDIRPDPAEAERERVKAQVRRAREAVTESDYTVAIDALREGLRLAPEEPKLQALLRQVEGAARRQRAESKRRRSLDDEVGSIRALLDAGHPAAARERLDDVEERLGGDPRLDEIRRELAGDAAGEEDAESLVAEAERLTRSEDYSAAREALRKAREMDPEHSRARTLSESVEALVELGRHESERRRHVDEAMAEIRAHLVEGRPNAAMAKLNRAVARYGDLDELQALRYEVATAFLEEDAVWESRDAAPAEITATRHAAPPPVPRAASEPESSAVPAAEPGPEESGDDPSDDDPSDDDSAPDLGTVDRIRLAGLGGDTGALPTRPDEGDVPKPPNPWLDLRDPRGWILLLLLLALVAFGGYWLATRGGGDDGRELETEDVEAPVLGVEARVSAGRIGVRIRRDGEDASIGSTGSAGVSKAGGSPAAGKIPALPVRTFVASEISAACPTTSEQPLEAQSVDPPVRLRVGAGRLGELGAPELHQVGPSSRPHEDGVHRLLPS